MIIAVIVQIPLLGRARKSAGEMTFTKWKDKNVLKNKASQVANPNTVNQQMRRGMFSQLVTAGRLFLPVFDLGFIAYRNTMSQFNAFIKFNYGLYVTPGIAPAFNVVDSALIFAKGPLTPTVPTNVVATNSSAAVTMTFPTTTSAPDQAVNDNAYAVWLNENTGDYAYQLTPVLRSSGTIAGTLNGNATTGDTVHGYLFFMRADGTIASDSEAFTIVVA